MSPEKPLSSQTAAQLFVRVLEKQGFTVVAAGWLLYWFTFVLNGHLTALDTNLKEHMYDTAYIALQICRNVAKDEKAAIACEPPGGLRHAP